MKRIIFFFLCVVLLGTSGCNQTNGAPPEYSIGNPVALALDDGTYLVAYQVNEGAGTRRTVNLSWIDERGEVFQSTNDIAPDLGGFQGNGNSTFATLISDNDGGTFVVCTSEAGVSLIKLNSNREIVIPLRMVAEIGNVQDSFQADSNGNGGVILSWNTGNNLTVMNLDTFGDEIWQTTIETPGVNVFDMTCDPLGNTFVLWNDNPNTTGSRGNLYVEELNSDGDLIFSKKVNGRSDGIYAESLGTFDNRIDSDDNGGFVVVYTEPGSLVTKRYNADGTGWTNKLPTDDMYSLPQVHFVNLGATVLAHDVAMHITHLGMEASRGGVYPGRYFATGADSLNQTAVVWADDNNLIAQCLDDTGGPDWGRLPISVSSIPAYWADYSIPARITSDGAGGFLVTWASGESLTGDRPDSWVQRISSDGELLWGENGIMLVKPGTLKLPSPE